MTAEFSCTHVVVGTGPAGCVVASELARRPGVRVLQLEAGPTEVSDKSSVPVLYPSFFQSDWDWNYCTDPQPHLNGRRIYWPRGMGVGGCSILNAMIWMPGDRADFASLAEIDSQWNPDLYFDSIRDQLVTQLQPEYRSNAEFNSKPRRYVHAWTELFLHAAHQYGLDSANLLSGHLAGADIFPVLQAEGRRFRLWETICGPFAQQGSLRLLPDTTAYRLVHLDRSVPSLEIAFANGERVTVAPETAVILCAGTLGTPELLWRSGIGDSSMLRDCGINAILDEPEVGSNLQDHLILPLIYGTSETGLPRQFSDQQVADWKQGKASPMASNIAEAGAFLKSPQSANEDLQRPEIQWHFTPTHYLEYPTRTSPSNALTIGVTLLRPPSRGRVDLVRIGDSLRTRIDPQYLSSPAEPQRWIDAIKQVRKFVANSELSQIAESEILPGNKRETDAQLLKAIRAYAQTLYHPVGTCRMGADRNAVVNPSLQLRTHPGVYIIDASILPEQPSCNPTGFLMMLAKRSSDWIA